MLSVRVSISGVRLSVRLAVRVIARLSVYASVSVIISYSGWFCVMVYFWFIYLNVTNHLKTYFNVFDPL